VRFTDYQALSFDCYGTLINWEAGIVEAFRKASTTDGVRLDPAAVLQTLFDARPAAERPYQSYREILTAAAQRVGQRLGWPISRERAAFLAESLADWPPFPDTNHALRRLNQAGCALGILSNVDDDLLAATRRCLEAEFSLLVTAEQVRSYKPASGHFNAAREQVGARRWLHAAQSYFHDVVPAVAHGISIAWINHKGEQPNEATRANYEFQNLTELTDWLADSREIGDRG